MFFHKVVDHIKLKLKVIIMFVETVKQHVELSYVIINESVLL
jgi:hypothetical protein